MLLHTAGNHANFIVYFWHKMEYAAIFDWNVVSFTGKKLVFDFDYNKTSILLSSFISCLSHFPYFRTVHCIHLVFLLNFNCEHLNRQMNMFVVQ